MKRCFLSLCLLGPGLVSTANAADVPLPLELPRPMFAGTPKPMNLPNLEKPRPGRRPAFMAPAGTVLLSAGKPVTSSDDFPIIGDIEFVTDGDKDGSDGYFVELGPELQWVQIDLEQNARIHAIVVWHFHLSPRAYHDVVVQVADDAAFSTNVRTIFNNDHDNSSSLGRGQDPAYIETYEGRLIPVGDETARFVRLSSHGSTSDGMNHYVEVEVFGQPAS